MTRFELLVNEAAQKALDEWQDGKTGMTARMIDYVENRISGFSRSQIRTAVHHAVRKVAVGITWVDGFNGKNRIS
ncbi:hypothetical protein ACN08N_23640 [Photobacterium leiognathi subsp. mandapamensis]|uniref:hypothetical protein n=1 Tax=Photobacterium leiognathi TaxID=553611 RepID=UPI003AF34EBC